MYQDNIEISETLLRIYRTSQNIFKEMIYLLLTMSEEFEGSRVFFVKKKKQQQKTGINIPKLSLESVGIKHAKDLIIAHKVLIF